MSTKEMRELDAWIAENVFKLFVKTEGTVKYCTMLIAQPWPGRGELKKYTEDAAAAMEVLKQCAEKLGDSCKDLTIGRVPDDAANLIGGKWAVTFLYRECDKQDINHFTVAETLELAICLFAKKLFTK